GVCQSLVPPPSQTPVQGEVIAVGFDKFDRVVVQTREPATLQIPEAGLTISLSNTSRADTGHMIFHASSGGGIASASRHLEGQEDGRTWSFACLGPRRTQSLGGGITGRAPFHWDGELKDFPALVDQIYVGRMSGRTLTTDQMNAAYGWLDTIPQLPPVVSDP